MENSGGGKHTVNSAKNPSPKTFLDPPPTIRFPPLFWRLSVISLKRKRHRPDQPQFLRPPKVVLESTLCSTFPPPKFTRYVLPPPQPLPKVFRGFEISEVFFWGISEVCLEVLSEALSEADFPLRGSQSCWP